MFDIAAAEARDLREHHGAKVARMMNTLVNAVAVAPASLVLSLLSTPGLQKVGPSGYLLLVPAYALAAGLPCR
jgi:hypothetical protein